MPEDKESGAGSPPRLNRRRWILGGGAAVLLGGGLALRKSDRSGPLDPYYARLAAALKAAHVGRPVLVVDRTRLRGNIAALRHTLAGSRLDTRVVVKSLPVRGLLEEIAGALGTTRYMVFNGPMIAETLRMAPRADLLLGKPLTADEVAAVTDELVAAGLDTAAPQWLADTPTRLREYAELARARNRVLRVNLEIDVGLHRGGFADAAALAAALDLLRSLPSLQFSGLMGYDPHVVHARNMDDAYASVLRRYRDAVACVRERHPQPAAPLTFNTAGSPTYKLHARDDVATEVAVGSAFVKPADFDTPTLTHHVPAAFIATPVLKVQDPTRIPGIEGLSGVMGFFDPNSAQTFFIHGGHWLARPESPPGLQFNPLFGRSSNQEMLNGSHRLHLSPGDYVFFRPTQSEAVLLQFGDLLVYEDGAIVNRWPTFPVSA